MLGCERTNVRVNAGHITYTPFLDFDKFSIKPDQATRGVDRYGCSLFQLRLSKRTCALTSRDHFQRRVCLALSRWER